MGMHSYHNGEHVDIVNKEGLREFCEAAEKLDEYKHYVDALDVNEQEGTVSFEGFDGWKIISYWYPSFLIFLRGLAIFVEGEVQFRFETGDEMARIQFEDAEVVLKLGEMKYEEVAIDDLMGGVRKSTKDDVLVSSMTTKENKLPGWLQKHKLLRKL